VTKDKLVQNIDITPTIAELANIVMPQTDRRSLVSPLVKADVEGRDIILLGYLKTGYHTAAV